MSEEASSPAPDQVPLCQSCVDAQGLCKRCQSSVLPQLKQPSWHKLVEKEPVKEPTPSPSDARLLMERMRKLALRKLSAALQGSRGRNRSKR